MKDKPFNKPTSAIDELAQLLMLDEEAEKAWNKPLDKPITTVEELTLYIINSYLKYLDEIIIGGYHVRFDYLRYEAAKATTGNYGEYTKEEWLSTVASKLIADIDNFQEVAPSELSFMARCGMIRIERLYELYINPVEDRIDALSVLSNEVQQFAKEIRNSK